jgi:hypothetical protein
MRRRLEGPETRRTVSGGQLESLRWCGLVHSGVDNGEDEFGRERTGRKSTGLAWQYEIGKTLVGCEKVPTGVSRGSRA